MKDEKIAMMNNYVVTLEATSYKEVPVSAASEEAALELAHEMYFNSGVLEFGDDDVVEITASIKDDDAHDIIEEENLDGLESLCDIIRFIRFTDAPEKVIARGLERALEYLLEERMALS
jgi:hypothetical protein